MICSRKIATCSSGASDSGDDGTGVVGRVGIAGTSGRAGVGACVGAVVAGVGEAASSRYDLPSSFHELGRIEVGLRRMLASGLSISSIALAPLLGTYEGGSGVTRLQPSRLKGEQVASPED